MQRGESKLSQHPIDALVREAIRAKQAVADDVVGRVIERMATVPFPTVASHLERHAQIGAQWTNATTDEHYLADLRRAIRDPNAQLAIYFRRRGYLSAVVAETRRIVPSERRGTNSLPLLFVLYSADRGIIVTGYQCSGIGRLNLPEDVRWLK